jgi:uncharacterized membrane protein YgdD (TMEM256/DUF423 family)
MTTPPRLLMMLAGLNGFLAVAAGAFGAHAVSDAAIKALLHTGASYELAAAAVGIGLLALRDTGGARTSAGLVLAGGFIFGTSLYALAFSGVRLFGAVTPIGGVLMLAGFGWLTVSALTARR